MALVGDDCYYFYYSTCGKGATCPFRHCEAALGNEVTCSQWEQGMCYRPYCKFRHMSITKNRSNIQCYWETQPSGCLKPHCVFHHSKPRPMEAGFTMPTHTASELSVDVPLPAVVQGVQTADKPVGVASPAQVATPQVAPVVINPFEEAHSSDESSEHGSPRKQPMTGAALRGVVLTTRKIISSEHEEMETSHIQRDGGVKIKTLQEIRRERMQMQPSEIQNTSQLSPTRQVQVKSLAEIRRGKLLSRLGNKSQRLAGRRDLEEEDDEEAMFQEVGQVEVKSQADIRKERLMSRLGTAYQRGIETKEQSIQGQPQMQIKTLTDIKRENLKRRLGKVPHESDDDQVTTEENSEAQSQETGQGKIKTLEEIKREKLLSRLGKFAKNPESDNKVESQQEGPVSIKTLEEIKREKVLRRLGKDSKESVTEKEEIKGPTQQPGNIQVKTLADIRREKALRNLGGAGQPARDADNGDTIDSKKQDSPTKLPVSKTAELQAPGGVKKNKAVRRVVLVDPQTVVEKAKTHAADKNPQTVIEKAQTHAAEKKSNNNIVVRKGIKREMQLYRPPRGKDTGPIVAGKAEVSPIKLAAKITGQTVSRAVEKVQVPGKSPEKVKVPRKSLEKVQVPGKSPEKAQISRKSPEKTAPVSEVKSPEQIKIKTFEEIMQEKKMRKQQEKPEEPEGKTPEVSPKLARKPVVPTQPLPEPTKGEEPPKKVTFAPTPVRVPPQELSTARRGIKRPLGSSVSTPADVRPVAVGQAVPKKPSTGTPSPTTENTSPVIVPGDGQAHLKEEFAAKKPKLTSTIAPTIPKETPLPPEPQKKTPSITEDLLAPSSDPQPEEKTSEPPPLASRQDSMDFDDFEFDLEGDDVDLAVGAADDDSLMAELDEMLNS
ncbi:zinc finger CCCH domain-containing protein 11A-like isoform X4 [Branchiostoma lanceolatum]|uniref:zinc finger CCCH domain-containing protein 11A-like isoform X4 n=1 Tax=Branchiostoma lanceolatum TaxID=7740 RepID=UPI0034539F37